MTLPISLTASSERPAAKAPGSSGLSTIVAKRWARRAVTVGVVGMLSLVHAVPVVSILSSGGDIPLPLAVGACDFLLVPILLFAVDRLLARRFQNVVSRAMLGAAVATLVGGAVGTLFWSGVIPRVALDALPNTVLDSFGMGWVLSILVVGAWSLAAVFPRVLEQDKVRALQLENLQLEASRLRAQGELARLRGQLEPHFLFNTLNLISGLVGMDVEKARSTIVSLGDLLRDALEPHGECQSIDGEIRWLERYTDILATRHGSKLAFDWEVEPRARAACVPRLLLQPLVENAIVHGALRASGTGLVIVRVRMPTAERIEITVEDNGPGLECGARPGAVGLANVRRRLELTRPGAALELEGGPAGTLARLSLPHTTHVPGEGLR